MIVVVSPSAFFCTFPAFNACIPLHCGALVWLAGISWPANKNLGESVWGIRSLAFTCLGYLSSLFVFQYDIIQYRKILHMILQCKLWNAHNVEKNNCVCNRYIVNFPHDSTGFESNSLFGFVAKLEFFVLLSGRKQ